MSLLTMVQNICQEVGLENPSTAYGNTATEVRQCLRFLYRTYQDLNLRGHWAELIKEHSITLATSTSAYPYPTDLDRVIYETEWNANDSWRMRPVDPVQYETMVRGLSTVSDINYFIAKGTTSNRFTVYPTPSTGDNGKKVYFLYISTYWIQSSAGTDKAAFTADTDISLLPEELVELGAKWRYKAENQLEYAEDKRMYEIMIPTKLKSKSSARTLRIDGVAQRQFLTTANFPEGNYGS